MWAIAIALVLGLTPQERVAANMHRIALSSEICIGQSQRKTALAAVAKEQRYSRIGGVVNLRTMADLQSDIRAADDRIATARRALKEERLTAVPCGDANLKVVITCRERLEDSDDDPGNTDPNDVCSNSDFRDILGLIHEYVQSIKEQRQ